MTINTIKDIIALAGGPEYVLGFRFANGYKVVFSNHVIDLEKDFIEVNESDILIFEHTDTFGKKAKSYLDVEEIVQIYTRDNLNERICIRDFME